KKKKWVGGSDKLAKNKKFIKNLLLSYKNTLGSELKIAVVVVRMTFDSLKTCTESKQWIIMGKWCVYSGTDTQDVVDSLKLF
ncbi:hypothetical protein C5B41_17140, partial [Acinetobacter ursingii]|uniref:hypothetical protein n=1 Tax=Acinetobacter ursingii TaxID=108980 RepID=UPI000D475424